MQTATFIDLTHTLHSDIPTWDMTCGFFLKTLRDYKQCPGQFKFRSQALDIRASAGTHIDAPAHCFEGARDINQLTIEELIRPCVVIDVSRQADAHYQISVADIKNFENQYDTIQLGTFVLFYTGWSRFWNSPDQYHNGLVFPTVSLQAAELLFFRHVAGIGIDTLSPDCAEKGFFVHELLLSADKYIVENVAHADKMPPTGAFIAIMPLAVQGAAESPVRLVGIVPKNIKNGPL